MRTFLTLLFLTCSMLLLAQDVTVTGFDGETHTGGSTITKTVEFPTDLSNVSQILMHISLSCPPGGCDPWDRLAKLSVVVDGEAMEIGRYATPYLLSTCGWTLDVTDYRNYLTGTTELASSIETYQNGWNIHTSFDFIEGTPEYEYVTVTQFYRDDLTYGDTLFYSINIPDYDFMVPENAEEVVFRVINTGHGQGNTDNAAEFSQKTHHIHVNGEERFSQYLWDPNCAQNPCANQAGTWQFARAGWCPGKAVVPWDYDVTQWGTPGGSVNVDYVLEPFYNLCSPWNIDCTPSNCNGGACTYNSSTHTTPVYKIALQMISKSSTQVSVEEVDPMEQLGIQVFPNPTEGLLNVTMKHSALLSVEVLDINGKAVMRSNMNTTRDQLDLRELRSGIYLLKMSGSEGIHSQRFILTH